MTGARQPPQEGAGGILPTAFTQVLPLLAPDKDTWGQSSSIRESQNRLGWRNLQSLSTSMGRTPSTSPGAESPTIIIITSMTSLDWRQAEVTKPNPCPWDARSWQRWATLSPTSGGHSPCHGTHQPQTGQRTTPAPTCQQSYDDTAQQHGQHHVGRVCKRGEPKTSAPEPI